MRIFHQILVGNQKEHLFFSSSMFYIKNEPNSNDMITAIGLKIQLI